MCYRLLAAVDPPLPPHEWRALANEQGVDLRADESAPEVRFAEVSWGDCACSLYTRREGRLRAVALVEALLARGHAVQLLLLQDGEEISFSNRPPTGLPLATFREGGLQSLPEGAVASILTATGTGC